MPTHPTWQPQDDRQSHPTYDTAVAAFERDVMRQVNQEMHGHDVHLVHATLTERLSGRLPGVELDDVNLRKIARAISDGTLTDWLAHTR
jgi:hypothetical protein